MFLYEVTEGCRISVGTKCHLEVNNMVAPADIFIASLAYPGHRVNHPSHLDFDTEDLFIVDEEFPVIIFL